MNARTDPPEQLSRQERSPGLADVFMKTATVSMESLSADTIDFTHGLTGTIPLSSGQLSITDTLTIDGPGADQVAVSGSQQSRVFSIGGGATVVVARSPLGTLGSGK